jgi:hypothetical protein
MNDLEQIEYPKSKKKRIELNTFVLNASNIFDYKYSNPDEFIIIDLSFDYSKVLLETIINGGTKHNIKKIITSDSVIVKYFMGIEKTFSTLFPNCCTIQINSFSNDYITISRVIDDLIMVVNVEYKLNDYVFVHNSATKYQYFFESFFTGSLANIKCVKIFNDIDDSKTNCLIEKNVITNIIVPSIIDKKNSTQFEYIKKYNIDKSYINNIHFEYVDNRRNIYFSKYIINVANIDFIDNDFFS